MKSSKLNERQAKRRVFIVDDHAVLRAGLCRIIQQEKDLAVCGEAETGAQALDLLADTEPDIAIVDLSLEGMSGMELIAAIRARWTDLRILVLSTHRENLYAERALKAGANGYIMKRESGATLMTAIRAVLSGKTHLSEDANQVIIEKLTHPGSASMDDPASALTDRELETFRLIGQGFGTRQISEALHISMKTVEAHRGHIRAKYGLASNYQLVQKAIKWVHQEPTFE